MLSVSPTYAVLNVAGSPFAGSISNADFGDFLVLYRYASLNRIPLLFLEAAERVGKLSPLKEELRSLRVRFKKIFMAFSRVSHALDNIGVNYALFKSVRPYREVTVDIDVLVFGSDYQKAARTLYSTNYRLLEVSPLSTTFYDDVAGINVDVYDEVGVSRIIYLDKDRLKNFVTDQRLPDGTVVRSLCAGADLLAVMAHSIMKEQMYVLSEYYTTLNFLLKMNSAELEDFLDLVNSCKLRSPVATHLTITALLHLFIYGFVPDKLKLLINEVGSNAREALMVARNGLLMPHKYHPLTIAEAIIEKLGEYKARRSLALQALSMLKPSFGLSVVKGILEHMTRESY